MPPKSKQTGSEWNQCIKCTSIIYGRELSKHKNECEAEKSLTHGHIVGSVFHGVVSPFPENFGMPIYYII